MEGPRGEKLSSFDRHFQLSILPPMWLESNYSNSSWESQGSCTTGCTSGGDREIEICVYECHRNSQNPVKAPVDPPKKPWKRLHADFALLFLIQCCRIITSLKISPRLKSGYYSIGIDLQLHFDPFQRLDHSLQVISKGSPPFSWCVLNHHAASAVYLLPSLGFPSLQ